MRAMLSAIAVSCLIASPAAAAQNPASVLNLAEARAFCAQGEVEAAEECLSDQKKAAKRIDYWLYRGDLPRFLSRRAYSSCHAFYGPDLRQVWACIEDNQDDRRDGRGVLSRTGITFGR